MGKKQNEKTNEILGQLFDDITNDKLPDDYPDTNYKAYKQILAMYVKDKNLDYDTIARIFNIEKRPRMDLLNLKEFIIIVTLIKGADFESHKIKCELMQVLLEAIESYLCTLN